MYNYNWCFMIKRIKNIKIETLIFFSIMFLLIGIPILIVFKYTRYCYGLASIELLDRVHLLWFISPFLLVLYIIDMIIHKRKVTYVDILTYLLIILAILSTIFAVDTNIALLGAKTRNEGLLSILSYYFIFLNLKNMTSEKYKNIIIKTIIILGIVQVIYGVLQVYTTLPFIVHFERPYMASGLSGNPNFFGSYMILLASLVFSMYMLERKKIYFVLSGIFFMGICLAASSGPFISFILIVIFFVIFYRKKIQWKNLLKVLLIFILVYFFVDYSVKYVHTNIFGNKINSNYNISMELKNIGSSNLGNGRIKLWKNSLPIVKEYWAVGVGLDNFGKVYGVRDGIYYDKVHNVYLQIAITNGIFALAIYLILLLIIFFKGLKLKRNLYISLLMAFTGYCIQAFINISVVEVAPTFFIICGLLMGRIQKNKANEKVIELIDNTMVVIQSKN